MSDQPNPEPTITFELSLEGKIVTTGSKSVFQFKVPVSSLPKVNDLDRFNFTREVERAIREQIYRVVIAQYVTNFIELAVE